ncbi:MAG: YARHG domain-containing protein [Crocinitomicaceae bacterium]
MKKKILPFAIAFLLFSCGGETQNDTTGEAPESVELIEDGDAAEDLLASNNMDPRTFGGEKNENQFFIDGLQYMEGEVGEAAGSYVGDFGKNMINITIFKMEDGEAEGYSVCAGNFRKITGTYEKAADGHYEFLMEEPGDDKYDGTFKFTAEMDAEIVLHGNWTPFNEGQSSKNYDLEKRSYSYDPTVGKYPQASQRELTDEDLNNLMEEELTEMRNEIYARHGYSFKNKEWRYHFEALDWYMPTGVDVRDKLTDIEVGNIELIYEYESYFQDYYDDYGR